MLNPLYGGQDPEFVKKIAEAFNLRGQTVQISAVRVFNPRGHTVQFRSAYSILEKCGGNIFFDPPTASSLAEAIKKLQASYESYRDAAGENREIVRQHYTRERMAGMLDEKIREFLAR
jgi:hypothetical protein